MTPNQQRILETSGWWESCSAAEKTNIVADWWDILSPRALQVISDINRVPKARNTWKDLDQRQIERYYTHVVLGIDL